MGVVQPSPKGIASASFTESVGLGASKPIAFWRQKKAGMYGRRLCAATDQNHRRICVTNHVFGALPLMAIMLSRKQEHRATARSITDFPTKATNAGGACTPHRDGCNPALTRPHDTPCPVLSEQLHIMEVLSEFEWRAAYRNVSRQKPGTTTGAEVSTRQLSLAHAGGAGIHFTMRRPDTGGARAERDREMPNVAIGGQHPGEIARANSGRAPCAVTRPAAR